MGTHTIRPGTRPGRRGASRHVHSVPDTPRHVGVTLDETAVRPTYVEAWNMNRFDLIVSPHGGTNISRE